MVQTTLPQKEEKLDGNENTRSELWRQLEFKGTLDSSLRKEKRVSQVCTVYLSS